MIKRNIQTVVAIIFLFLSFLLVPIAHASPSGDIKLWFERMAHASTELSYKGRFVYNRDGETSLMEIVHVVGDKGSRERIVSLSGKDQELIRDQQGNVFLMNIGLPLLVDKDGRDIPLAVRINANFERLSENYKFELAEKDRVAGYESQVITISPKDEHRYSYRLWVDLKTGFLSRSQLLNENGEVVEHIMFSDIELMAEPSEELLDAVLYDTDLIAKSRSAVIDKVVSSVDSEIFWNIAGSPLGFWRAQSQDEVSLGDKKSVAYLMVTDGLASVSIYIEPSKSKSDGLIGASRVGALSAYGRVIDGYQITVVGEVPPLTVKEIGDAVIQTRMSQR
ncbi:MAG: MucB/RseB C-terminal domain-containing protein [Thiotrichales bacterium]|nr:MucB/RseB C-terminal domain-containing protein [Thiotrichales bacterium]